MAQVSFGVSDSLALLSWGCVRFVGATVCSAFAFAFVLVPPAVVVVGSNCDHLLRWCVCVVLVGHPIGRSPPFVTIFCAAFAGLRGAKSVSIA